MEYHCATLDLMAGLFSAAHIQTDVHTHIHETMHTHTHTHHSSDKHIQPHQSHVKMTMILLSFITGVLARTYLDCFNEISVILRRSDDGEWGIICCATVARCICIYLSVGTVIHLPSRTSAWEIGQPGIKVEKTDKSGENRLD